MVALMLTITFILVGQHQLVLKNANKKMIVNEPPSNIPVIKHSSVGYSLTREYYYANRCLITFHWFPLQDLPPGLFLSFFCAWR